MYFTKLLTVVAACLVLYQVISRISTWLQKNSTNRQEYNLKDEIILVTGGSGGIGKQIVEDLHKRQARVIILDVKKPAFELPPGMTFHEVDLRSSESIMQVATQIRESQGDPAVIVNNAGVCHIAPLLEKSEQAIRDTFEVNTISHFLIAKAFLPSMIQKNHGHIITVASVASFVTVGGMVDYCCTKASAVAFHEGIRQELKAWYKASNVKTSIIHPLWVDTPMIKSLTDDQTHFRQPVMSPQAVSDAVVEQIVLRRGDQIILPRTMGIAGYLRAFPHWLQEIVRSFHSEIVWKIGEVAPIKS
ncbi:hypothetical protein N7478_013313 [Penicillium angulare]|uniref:uncharacterized protein n=1 Tax=Penicillium angulare TaxID=116970 RepID=UPI0025408DC8|nr:uncharacterized protein N7478_013313 [Penicillium angulare]KAJ5257209.1 hypothetical protein N7478_013313 [Penicillium angulare]